MLLSYFGVSIVLFIVSRFSPYEWRLFSSTGKRVPIKMITTTYLVIPFPFFAFHFLLNSPLPFVSHDVYGVFFGGFKVEGFTNDLNSSL